MMKQDQENRSHVMEEQQALLETCYNLHNHPAQEVLMFNGKPVQGGVRVKLPSALPWEQLAQMDPSRIVGKICFRKGFDPLPHAKHETGGMVFPHLQIEAMQQQEQHSLERFDVAFDLPDHLLPEFPPPIYLSSRSDLGDVSQEKVLPIHN